MDLVYRQGGSTSYRRESRLAECWRDLQVVGQAVTIMPEWYPNLVRVPQAWGFGYKLTDGNRRARLLTESAWPYVRRSIRKLVAQHQRAHQRQPGIFGDYLRIKEGMTVRATGQLLSVPVGDGVIGRVINAVGQSIDGKGPIQSSKFRPIEVIAPNVVKRQPVNAPVLSVTATDKSTIVMKLKEPIFYALQLFASNFTGNVPIMPKEISAITGPIVMTLPKNCR